MSRTLSFLALDLGAESGRAVLGRLASGRLSLEEVHRFPNRPLLRDGGWRWDVSALWEEIKKGMRLCLERNGSPPLSLGVDTWGVDFGLLDEGGKLLDLPFSYRDERTRGAMESFFARLPREEIYRLTGIQFLSLNTLFQLESMVRDRSPLLGRAASLLFMPDLFHYFLTGERCTEFSIATTSQLFDPRRLAWSAEIFEALGLPLSLMRRPVQPGTVIGPLLEGVGRETGCADSLAVASLTHDTAAAVAAVPAEGREWAFISSGTWSLAGVEVERPLISGPALTLNFTNEGGIERTVRFLKNIAGLWLVQRCKAAWESSRPGRAYDYDDLSDMAAGAPAFRSFIDPDALDFVNPADMPSAIRTFARRTNQPEPGTPGEFVRCILESLAFKYRSVLDQAEALTGRPIRTVHVIGGGARNTLLNRFTAAACGRPVVAGPAEATSCGNILGQALALGYIRSGAEAREVARNSSQTHTFPPEGSEAWGKTLPRFLALLEESRSGGPA